MFFAKNPFTVSCFCLLFVVFVGCGSDEDKKSGGGSSAQVDYEKSLIGTWSLDSKASLAAANFEDGDAAKKAAEGFVNAIKMTLEFKDDGSGSLTLEMGPQQTQTIPVKFVFKKVEDKVVTLNVTPEGKDPEDFTFKFVNLDTVEWSPLDPDSKQGIPGPLNTLVMARGE